MVRRTNFDDIVKSILLPKPQLTRLSEDLKQAGLVCISGSIIYAKSLKKTFAARHIVAIEAKLRDWRKAIQQAVANMWFASHSYILLPPSRSLKLIVQEAKKFGIGVLIFDGNKTRRIMKPRPQQLPASYGILACQQLGANRMKRICD